VIAQQYAVLIEQLVTFAPVSPERGALVEAALEVWRRPAFDTLASLSQLRFDPLRLPAASGSRGAPADGLVMSGGRELPFALQWRAEERTPVAAVQAFPLTVVARLDRWTGVVGARLRQSITDRLGSPPPPVVPLAEPASATLRNASRRAGLASGRALRDAPDAGW
jgi:hypothetical protein